MKKLLTVLILILLSNYPVHSQSLSLFYNQVQLSNNSTLVRTGTSDSLEMTTWMMIRNDANKVMQVHAKKIEISLASGAAGSICWAGYCYNPSILESLHPLTLGAGEEKIGCFAHFTPGGSIGTSLVRWVYYDMENPDDSVSVTINYITYPAGIGTSSSGEELFSPPFPNPADNEVRFSCLSELTGESSILVYDQRGSVVYKGNLRKTTGVVHINTSTLYNGVYYISLFTDGNPVFSRKMIICH